MSDVRIALIGSCQVAGMKATATRLLPSAHIEAQHIFVTMQPEEIPVYLKNFDLCVTQIQDDDHRISHLSANALKSSTLDAVYLPTFVFSGLHPDMAYILKEGKIVSGPYGDLHSAIGASCFLAGCSEARTAKLFNKYIFAELGYLDEYAVSHRFMIDTYAAAGYDVERLLSSLRAVSGPFMYTANHPAISIIAELTTQALKKIGAVPDNASVPAGVHDALAEHLVLPVFPPIARNAGFEGGSTYLRQARPGEDRRLPLEEYLSLSFDIYRQLDRETIAQGRILEAFNVIAPLIR
jgi:hypothetical protein